MLFGRGSVWLGAALAFAASLAAQPAHAGASARLVYARSERGLACPDQAALERAVAQRLGYSPFFPWAEQTIVAEISGTGPQLVARAQLVDDKGVARGKRQLKGDVARCDELIAAIALAISITLDPLSVNRPTAAEADASPGGNEAASPEPEAVTSPPAPVQPAPAPAQRDTVLRPIQRDASAANVDSDAAINAAFDVGIFTEVGELPEVMPGLRLGVRIDRGVFRLGIEGAGLLPAERAADAGGKIRVSLMVASLYPCLRWSLFEGCVLASLGQLHAEGQGVLNPREESRVYGALGLRAAAALPLGSRFSLEGHADVQKTLNMLRFELDGAQVWQPSQVSAAIGLDLAMLFL